MHKTPPSIQPVCSKASLAASLRSLLCCLTASIVLLGCAPIRPSLPPGEIPAQTTVPAADEQYGHEVLNALTQQFPLDDNDQRIIRTREIVETVASAASVDQNPWHVYVLKDDDFKNAAATRGNFIFVWTGMLQSLDSDDELAAVLAHEMAHVLAGHTQPDPAEEVRRILTGIAGRATREVLVRQGNMTGVVISLSEQVVQQALKALLINPESQRKEIEADTMGLFLMAEAGYDPSKALAFWERVKNDPHFAGFPLAFLSSHPTSEERIENIRKHLPAAMARYTGEDESSSVPPARNEAALTWVVLEPSVYVYAEPRVNSTVRAELKENEVVSVRRLTGRWLYINDPVEGYIQSFKLAPTSSASDK